MRNECWEITEEDYALAKARGLSRDSVYKRVYNGMSIKDAISRPIVDRAGKGLWSLWRGRSEVCRASFYRNVSLGMSPEEAIIKRRAWNRREMERWGK